MIDDILLNHLLPGQDEINVLWFDCSFCTFLLFFFFFSFFLAGHHLTDAAYILHKAKATLRDWQSNQAALWFTRPSTWLSEQVKKGAETEHGVHPLHSTFPTHNYAHTHFWSLAVLFFFLPLQYSIYSLFLQLWSSEVHDGAADTECWCRFVVEMKMLRVNSLIEVESFIWDDLNLYDTFLCIICRALKTKVLWQCACEEGGDD